MKNLGWIKVEPLTPISANSQGHKHDVSPPVKVTVYRDIDCHHEIGEIRVSWWDLRQKCGNETYIFKGTLAKDSKEFYMEMIYCKDNPDDPLGVIQFDVF